MGNIIKDNSLINFPMENLILSVSQNHIDEFLLKNNLLVMPIKNLNPNEKTLKFIEKARKIHGSKYCYDYVFYIRDIDKVLIYCYDHGFFWQNPSGHLKGKR